MRMRILYVNGFPAFARATLGLLNDKHLNLDWTVVPVETADVALEKLKNERFDLVISTVVLPGISSPEAESPSRYGGFELYHFVCNRNAFIRAEYKMAYCLLTRSERHVILDYFDTFFRRLDAEIPRPPVFGRGTPLHEIIEYVEIENLKAFAAKRPAHGKTAERKNPPAVEKECSL